MSSQLIWVGAQIGLGFLAEFQHGLGVFFVVGIKKMEISNWRHENFFLDF